MKKHGLDLLQEQLAAAGKTKEAAPSETAVDTPPLPPELAEFVRQMALRNGIDPSTGEGPAVSSARH